MTIIYKISHQRLSKPYNIFDLKVSYYPSYIFYQYFTIKNTLFRLYQFSTYHILSNLILNFTFSYKYLI